MLVETLTGQYSKYYHAADGNPPFTLQDEQLGAVMILKNALMELSAFSGREVLEIYIQR